MGIWVVAYLGLGAVIGFVALADQYDSVVGLLSGIVSSALIGVPVLAMMLAVRAWQAWTSAFSGATYESRSQR
jgi:hypothetical protein